MLSALDKAGERARGGKREKDDMKISLPFDILDGCNPRRLMEWRRFNKGISSPPLSSPPLRYPIFNCTACSAVHPLGDIAYQIEQGRGEGGGGFLLVAQDIQCVQGRGCQSQSASLTIASRFSQTPRNHCAMPHAKEDYGRL